jgi:copper(I)-binding protein
VSDSGRGRIARRAGVALAAVLLSASCAAGQHAQTLDVVPALDGTYGAVGNLRLDGVAIPTPSQSSYAAGANIPLALTLVNSGNSPDTLVNVTGSDFTGWGIVDNADAGSVSGSSGADTGLTVAPNSAQRLSLVTQGASADASPRTLVLMGLAAKAAPLRPGSTVDLTFRFANAGTTTLHVPVQLASAPNGASIPAPSSAAVD